MLNERPSMPAAVERAKSGFVYNFMHKLGEPRVLGWISVAFVLIMWEVVVAAAHLNPIYLPRPTHILIALVKMFQTGGLLSDLLATLVRTPVTLQGQEVWRAPAWSMSLGVALLVQFP